MPCDSAIERDAEGMPARLWVGRREAAETPAGCRHETTWKDLGGRRRCATCGEVLPEGDAT